MGISLATVMIAEQNGADVRQPSRQKYVFDTATKLVLLPKSVRGDGMQHYARAHTGGIVYLNLVGFQFEVIYIDKIFPEVEALFDDEYISLPVRLDTILMGEVSVPAEARVLVTDSDERGVVYVCPEKVCEPV